MTREGLPAHKPETVDWSAEAKERIPDKLLPLLERRASHTPDNSLDRIEKLRNAIQKLPKQLDTLLSAFENHLKSAGVAALEVYILGGFAREATGQRIDENTNIDTSIRPDTDIDVFILCMPKDGVILNPQRILNSPFTPITSQWREGELGNVVEIAFGVVNSPKTLQPEKAKILLWRKALSET